MNTATDPRLSADRRGGIRTKDHAGPGARASSCSVWPGIPASARPAMRSRSVSTWSTTKASFDNSLVGIWASSSVSLPDHLPNAKEALSVYGVPALGA